MDQLSEQLQGPGKKLGDAVTEAVKEVAKVFDDRTAAQIDQKLGVANLAAQIVQGMKPDLDSFKQEMLTLINTHNEARKADMDALKADMDALKTDVTALNSKMDIMMPAAINAANLAARLHNMNAGLDDKLQWPYHDNKLPKHAESQPPDLTKNEILFNLTGTTVKPLLQHYDILEQHKNESVNKLRTILLKHIGAEKPT